MLELVEDEEVDDDEEASAPDEDDEEDDEAVPDDEEDDDELDADVSGGVAGGSDEQATATRARVSTTAPVWRMPSP